MESNALLIISSKKTGKEWTATATLSNGDFAGTCTSKNRSRAEREARQSAERRLRRQRPDPEASKTFLGKMLGGFIGRMDQLEASTITATAAAISR